MVFLNVNFERAMIYNQNLTTNIPIVSSFPIILPLSGFLKLIFTVEFVEFRIFNLTLFLVQVSPYCSYLASRKWMVKNIGPRRPKEDITNNEVKVTSMLVTDTKKHQHNGKVANIMILSPTSSIIKSKKLIPHPPVMGLILSDPLVLLQNMRH